MTDTQTELRSLATQTRQLCADASLQIMAASVSFKTRERLWISAPNQSAGDALAEQFIELDRAKLDGLLQTDWPANASERGNLFSAALMNARVRPDLSQRPPVETLLHHLMTAPIVAHIQSGPVNAMTCCTRGPKVCAEIFGDDIIWQNYFDPDVTLAKSLQVSLGDYRAKLSREPLAVAIASHGALVSTTSIDALQITISDVVGKCQTKLNSIAQDGFVGNRYRDNSAFLASVEQFAKSRGFVKSDASDDVMNLVSWTTGREIAMLTPITPSQIVNCRSIPMWIEPAADGVSAANFEMSWLAYVKEFGGAPWVILVGGAGLIAVRSTQSQANHTAKFYADIAGVYRNAFRLGGVRKLAVGERKFIEDLHANQRGTEAFMRSA